MKRESGLRAYGRMLMSDKLALASACYLTLVVLVTIFGAMLLPAGGSGQSLTERMRPPFDFGNPPMHFLGTDALGRSMVERLILAGRTSVVIAFSSALLAAFIGTTIGILAGYRGGWIAAVAMRFADVVLSFPMLLLAILMLYVLRSNAFNIVILLTIAQIPLYLRAARAETLEIRRRPAVEAVRCLGASEARIYRQEIFPNVLPTIMTLIALDVGMLMLAESGLSFIGVGIQPPDVSWGGMVAEGRRWIATSWWLCFFPGLAIFLTALSCNLLSNWLRLATNPVHRWRFDRQDPKRGDCPAATGDRETAA